MAFPLPLIPSPLVLLLVVTTICVVSAANIPLHPESTVHATASASQLLHPPDQELLQVESAQAAAAAAANARKPEVPEDPVVGARDRFWRHHVEQRSLVWNGENQFDNIDECWKKQLTAEGLLEDYYNDAIRAPRKVVGKVAEYINFFDSDDDDDDDDKSGSASSEDEDEENEEEEEDESERPDRMLTYAVVLEDAIKPSHARAVQSLAQCVRTYLPHLYESRAMYKEMDMAAEDEEDPKGGNCPTHLAPLVSVFLPEVFREQQRVLQVAYDAAGWKYYTDREIEDEDALQLERRGNIEMPPPDKVGVRASEHLTYSDFPSLGSHTDGASKYTMNFAFSGPEDYEGGEFFLLSQNKKNLGKRTYLKPKKYGAIVFLGGRYEHGVSDITGGHREMFSTEFWYYPDLPFGSTLWSAIEENMEVYIKKCNKELANGGVPPCTANFPNMTAYEAVKKREQQEREQQKRRPPGRVHPHPLVPIGFIDEFTGKEYAIDDFLPEEDEPDFLIPAELEKGEMIPIRWRDSLQPVDGSDGESFVIGFPPELHREFVKYVERSGMMDVARSILYEEEKLEDGQHRIYTLNDGKKWGAMIPGDWRTDMIWLDPADEECFESLVALLGRGGFDTVLDKVGKAFGLNGLMIQGVGAIFLSHKERSSNMHRDIPGSKGSFYNIIVPVYIPEDETSTLYVGEEDDEGKGERQGTICLDPNVGVILGGESLHGTGECDYRKQQDFRLSFAIYVADINEQNIDLIASDSTSLWPTQGDTDWFWSQRGRFWSRNGKRSLRKDKGRRTLDVKDHDSACTSKAHLCESDPLGWRLKCPKTCRLYLADDEYYKKVGVKSNRTKSDANKHDQPPDHAKAQIDWIRSHGGFFNRKLAVRRFNESDPDSPFGVFTNEELNEGEQLMVIPRKCLLTGEGSLSLCDTTRNLLKHRELGDESSFAPYVNYVLDPKHQGQVPASWSKAGKALLETIIGMEMAPRAVSSISFRDECGGSGDPLEEIAYQTVVRRSWDDKMLPVYDMVNHRNGRWFNVDSSSAHDEENDVNVFTRRKVEAGEQLYLSYNECTDCDYALTYVLQDILKDYGFVENYPQRWRFNPYEETDVVFQVDKDPVSGELQLEWLTGVPSGNEIMFFRGHLRRLEGMKDHVINEAGNLKSEHEQSVALEFYEALSTAMDLAISSFEAVAGGNEDCFIGESTNCTRFYDDLAAPSEIVLWNEEVFVQYIDSSSFEPLDERESQYTDIHFEYSEVLQDTCLRLNGHLQTCTSFRSHYHEVFVHYPAQFVDEVKRVAFMGGGDNMILHEILKYPSLELVVGMELDHDVVRSSFKNLGTQPHWDNEKLEWWYGDASKTLYMLPEEYYGSFDLVLLDLETNVVDMLTVAENHTIMDAALMLLKEDGVMARNEDWFFGSNDPFAKYMVDLFYVDVPFIGHQGISVASEAVDFFSRSPKDHKIENIYLQPVNERNRFEGWYNYRTSNSTKRNAMPRDWRAQSSSGPGVLMVIEAEEASASLNSTALKQKIIEALETIGLHSRTAAELPGGDDADNAAILFALEEGYIVVRSWQGISTYYGIDVMLWGNFEKLNAAKEVLIAAVGSKSPSTYRIVLDGITQGNGREPIQTAGTIDFQECDVLADEGVVTPVNESVAAAALTESIALAHGPNTSVLVFCGEKTQSCETNEILKESNRHAFPIHTCFNITELDAGNMSQFMLDCEKETLHRLTEAIETDSRIDVIAIDSKVPHRMGQIIHALFSSKTIRKKVLADDHVVLATTLDPSESWRRALLDRFRTEFVQFDPAFQTDIVFKGAQGQLELNVFSSGDSNFFEHLADVVSTVETKTELTSSVKHVRNGVNVYVADFRPSLITSHKDYDRQSPLQQWKSQQPLGEQVVLQFVDEANEPSLSTGLIRESLLETLKVLDAEEDEDYQKGKNNGQDNPRVDVQSFDAASNGCVTFVASWLDCSIVLIWDGKFALTLNIFSEEHIDGFEEEFLSAFPSSLSLTSHQEFPRGHGRVVNFPEDIGDELPHWA